MADQKFIQVCEPLLTGNELAYVTDAIETGWISSSGSYVAEFERKFAEFCGVKHAVSVNTGTAALHLACVALGIGPGDEVIIPTFTMIASAYAVCYCGAMPVFVDCERQTWNMDVCRIEEKITSKTKAIMPVHIYGHPCDMDQVIKLAKQYGLVIIEDAAETHGAEYKRRRCGALGNIGCFSFFGNKIITTGEGGMVVMNDRQLFDRCRYLKNMSFPLDGPRDYTHGEIAFNYRMSNVIAAIGLAQTEKAAYYVDRRRQNARHYNDRLAQCPGITLPIEQEWAKNVYWMYGIIIEDEFGMSRQDVMIALRKKGIDSRPFFRPMHDQPALFNYGCELSGYYPVADEIASKGVYLPSGSGLTGEQIDTVCNGLLELKR